MINRKSKEEMRLAIVVPCYKEEAVLVETTKRLTKVMEALINRKLITPNSFILYVNDGSTDGTWSLISTLHSNNKSICGVNLASNVGHQNALMAGLTVAGRFCDIAISIDADLQDDTAVIEEMVIKYKEGFDIVYGVRKSRTSDTFFKRFTALSFYKFMRAMGIKSVYNHADYRLMSKRAIEQLCKFRERNLFLRGIVPLIGYNTTSVYYDRVERFAGESKYPFNKMPELRNRRYYLFFCETGENDPSGRTTVSINNCGSIGLYLTFTLDWSCCSGVDFTDAFSLVCGSCNFD